MNQLQIQNKKLKSQKAFTLVELIIVITILAVLATIAFLSFQSYTKDSRDASRAVNLSDITKALEIHKTTTSRFPTPDDISGTGQMLGVNLFQVGKVGASNASLLKFDKTPVDPLTKTPYAYGLSLDNKYFQVAGTFENVNAGTHLVSSTYAATNNKAKVEGNYKGLLKFSTGSNQYIGNVPSLIFSTGGTYNLIEEDPYFVINNGKNLPYVVTSGDTTSNQVKAEIMQAVTGQPTVTLTGVIVSDWSTKADDIVAAIGYPKDLVGVEVLGTEYYLIPSTPEEYNTCPTNPTPEEYFTFIGGTITGYSFGGPKNVVIPCTIGGESVTSIGQDAFRGNQLTSVIIPNSVTSIGMSAFHENQLTSVTIPNSVISIGVLAFNDNQLPDDQAFIYMRNGDGSIDNTHIIGYGGINKSPIIPNSVMSIGDWVFTYNQLTSVTIPNSVTSIGESAFSENQLTSVTIPNSVTSIGDWAFSNNQLTSVTIPNSVTSIGERTFSSNQLTAVIIPNSVISIGNYAFYYNQLTSITIGNSVTSIGQQAFRSNRLTSITIPNSVTSIGTDAFRNNGTSSTSNNITTWNSGNGGTWNISGSNWVKQS